MMHLFESFGCGLCFSIGVIAGISMVTLSHKKDRAAFAKEISESNKRVEERVGVYVEAMALILEHVKQQQKPK